MFVKGSSFTVHSVHEKEEVKLVCKMRVVCQPKYRDDVFPNIHTVSKIILLGQINTTQFYSRIVH